MRRRLLPSLSALRTFEAVARRESFTLAAVELNVTQSAASRQVRTLETYLDVPLFKRTSRRSELTADGRYYFNLIRESLDRIEAGTTELIATRKGGGTLSIGVLPTFGTRWLIPRLGLFRARHPEILVNVVSTDGQFVSDMPKFDLAIQFGNGHWPDAVAEPLMAEEIVVACSPHLPCAEAPLDRLSDLSRHALLQHTTRPQAWAHWFRSVGFAEQDAHWGPSFEHFFMLIQAAQSGLGVALLPRVLIEAELARQELVAPLAYRVAGPGAYYLVTPKAKQDLARVKLFRRWLLDEVARLPPQENQWRTDGIIPGQASFAALQRVAEPVAEQVHGEHGPEDQQAGWQHHPRGGADPRDGAVEQVAPGRDRWLHPEAEEGHRGLQHDRVADCEGR